MKNLVVITLTAILIFTMSCTKTQVAPVKKESESKILLTQGTWKLTEFSWKKGATTVLTVDSLTPCTRKDAYKFNDWIMSVPSGTERTCTTEPAQSGKFVISDNGKHFEFSMFMNAVDSLLIYDVKELSANRFEIQTTTDARNNGNDVTMVFTR